MIFLKLLYSLVFPYCVGHAALLVLLGRRYRLNRLFVPPVAFGLGLGILSVGMLILAMLGIPFTPMHVSLMLAVILAAFVLTLTGRRKKPDAVTGLIKFPPEKEILNEGALIKCLYVVFIAVAAYYLHFIFWRALNIPIHEWDSLASSIYNAKVFYFDGNLDKFKWLPHSVFPIQLPLLCVWTSLCLGHWDDQYVKILFPLIFIAFTVIYYGFLRYWTGRTWAVFGTLCLFSSNLFVFHATLSYRDLFLCYYTCGAVMFLMLWLEKKETVFLLLAGWLAGFGSFLKLEGSVYMVLQSLLVFCLVFFRGSTTLSEKIRIAAHFCVPSWSIFILYYCYKMAHGVSTVHYTEPGMEGLYPKFMSSLTAYINVIFFSSNWNIFWGWLIFSIVFNPKTVRTNTNIQILLVMLFAYVGFHFGLSLLLGISSNMISPFTISRLFLHFFPLIPLLVVLINATVFKPE